LEKIIIFMQTYLNMYITIVINNMRYLHKYVDIVDTTRQRPTLP
jgi:hypothetical protein